MTKDEALRFLASASMRNHLSLPIGSTAAIEHNQKVAEAVASPKDAVPSAVTR